MKFFTLKSQEHFTHTMICIILKSDEEGHGTNFIVITNQ